ncbi:MAG: lysine exporter LysO family protein [Clostridiaceae bacterium]|nr:lysine exporter LysO family protein [Clostridiaceae bacterium]
MMILTMVCSLFLGLFYGISGVNFHFIDTISQNTDIILYILMFFVGISVGMQRGLFSKIKEYHLKILIIPFGIILGSFLGGIICSFILKIPVGYGTAITSGLGWYSLSGVTISSMASAELGSIAFLSNLLREMFSFLIIPFLAVHFNHYTCIASAAATSEDTTLPIILKYTNEETVVLSVLNGIICSLMVPVLIPLCLSMV